MRARTPLPETRHSRVVLSGSQEGPTTDARCKAACRWERDGRSQRVHGCTLWGATRPGAGPSGAGTVLRELVKGGFRGNILRAVEGRCGTIGWDLRPFFRGTDGVVDHSFLRCVLSIAACHRTRPPLPLGAWSSCPRALAILYSSSTGRARPRRSCTPGGLWGGLWGVRVV